MKRTPIISGEGILEPDTTTTANRYGRFILWH